ncbi:hypothetical protein GBA63_19175 [Rubrobacter tropicus]|uniref:Uncharacterized protein n=1 Tax=Rubrobacter tropicus TaxID=2653851 RepID=A0A6G8QDH3_9ACTN|nr:hypothetical protein [Rubrobacter tropicus]QIN84529.1 hypothetical protein GBA63_19175 [Rubrobacter tropicus]
MNGKTYGETWSAITGATRYEFLMQLRRRAVWTVVGLFVAWGFAAFRFYVALGGDEAETLSLAQWMASWSLVAQYFAPIGFGILVADRLPRDGGTWVGELLETLPGSAGGRFFGKYLGSVAATLVPLLLIYLAGVAYLVFERGNLMAIPLGLLTFAAINLSGLLFVAAFSISCPAVLWVPLYQTLFVGYWFWGNLLSPDSTIPTISGTILTPVGWYPAAGFFDLKGTNAGDATAWEAVVSIASLLALAALALYGAHRYLRWQRARQ